MTKSYAFSLQGLAHAGEGRECQDASLCAEAAGGRAVIGVADGVGSAAKSADGSKAAVGAAVDFVVDYLPADADARVLCSVVLAAMLVADGAVQARAFAAGDAPELYDTTLTLAVLDGTCCYVGHSGDGGALGITASGEVVPLTAEQKGEDGVSVIPLSAGPCCWQVARYAEPLQAVLLATDGLLAQLKPYALRGAEGRSAVYEPLALYLADPAGGCEAACEAATALLERQDATVRSVAERLAVVARAHGVPEDADDLREPAATVVSLAERVLDDVSVAVAMASNGGAQRARADLFQEPDWAALQEAFDRRLYGGAA